LYSFFTFFITLRHHSAKLCSCCPGTQPPRFRGANRLYQTLSCHHTWNQQVLYCFVKLVN
jgi:hypothetical protein